VHGAPLLPHQLQAASWLRSMWLHRRAAVLADDQGLGKTASTAAYIASLLHEFHVTSPVLVVAPLAMLSFWEGACLLCVPYRAGLGAACCCARRERCSAACVFLLLLSLLLPFAPGELAFWLPLESHVVTYSGSVSARAVLQVRVCVCVSIGGVACMLACVVTLARCHAVPDNAVSRPAILTHTHNVQEHELWLQPSSMDAKAGFNSSATSRAGLSTRTPKPDVVLTTYEVVCSGMARGSVTACRG
jgi:hypothetical protein